MGRLPWISGLIRNRSFGTWPGALESGVLRSSKSGGLRFWKLWTRGSSLSNKGSLDEDPELITYYPPCFSKQIRLIYSTYLFSELFIWPGNFAQLRDPKQTGGC